MSHYLLVVESPKKAKTIKKYLGADFTVTASVGHIKDLPKNDLGIDVENSFTPEYEVIRGKGSVIKEIKAAAKKADTVYLATDPDREGEAIAFHIAEELGKNQAGKVKRLLFHEITERAIKEAIEHPVALDAHKFDSQQARRVLDRLVGYKISPILWKKIQRGLSAGRVQSVAVRLIVEREEAIRAFQPEEYWTLEVILKAKTPPIFSAKLMKVDGKKPEIHSGDEALKLAHEIEHSDFTVLSVEHKERRRMPLPPYITSKMQQDAANRLNFTSKRTMALAQQLYEGIDIGDEGSVGLITYMRTDSPRIAPEAVTEVRKYISQTYGKDDLPAKPNTYKTKGTAQDAHEAIRPTSMKYTPEMVQPYLDKDQFRLYRLIWDRFVACQMKPAIYEITGVDIGAGRALFRATDSKLKYMGWLKVYGVKDTLLKERSDQEKADGEDNGIVNKELPELAENDALTLKELTKNQHFTTPPPRFTEATLNKELEERGIGRPSTMASIISTIQDREYVEKESGAFRPTDLGTIVTHELVRAFPEELDPTFTAHMEDKLDDVENGKSGWVNLIQDFYGPFQKRLDAAEDNMRDVKREETPTDLLCEKCGKPMVIKWGRLGQFLACKGYPECKNTKNFQRGTDGTIEPEVQETTDEVCPNCGKPMMFKTGRFGKFLACTDYPTCKTTKKITTGVKCPQCNKGEFVERKSQKKNKTYYSCNNYPECRNVVWDKPVNRPCPQCGAPFTTQKVARSGAVRHACANKNCGWVEPGAGESEESPST